MEAKEYFDRIGYGKENAVRRPANSYADRQLRKMIETANREGDCIISCGEGYYRPLQEREGEQSELRHYFASELHRARAILYKRKSMMKTAKKWREAGCQKTAARKEPPENGSLPQSYGNMVIVADEDSSIPGQMVMRMW